MKNLVIFLSMFMCSQTAFSAVYLYNNTPYALKAQVIGANGVKIGEKLIESQKTAYVEDQIGTADPVATNANKPFQNYKDSVTPYQVFWYCGEDADKLYGACTLVGSGATVMATTCSGPCYCEPPKEKKAEKSADASKDE